MFYYYLHRIIARRRRGDESYQYRVEFTDGSTNWLLPRNIPLTMVRMFNARKRRWTERWHDISTAHSDMAA